MRRGTIGGKLVLSVTLAIALLVGLSGSALALGAPGETTFPPAADEAPPVVVPGAPAVAAAGAAEIPPGNARGRGVRVAVLDSGIDLDHSDLRVAGDVSFVDGAGDGDDDNGHGTMVAGIIAALDNGVGVTGVAPDAELYAVKVLDSAGHGTGAGIVGGIEWAIDNEMQVIVMSFGSARSLPRSVRRALDRAAKAGIVLVAGAGNTGDQGIIYAPANHEAVIAVGAADRRGERADFSGTGADLELLAPGTGIVSTYRGGGYATGSGTSLAAPYVAGLAARLIAAGTGDSDAIRDRLHKTARDLEVPGRDAQTGYGLVLATALE